jgi:AcrR family transcriptional regulator
MGSKERINRHKENIRHNILGAALAIGKEAGWNSLSMRKIADFIEYTPPIIYEYFSSKEALLQELARLGFLKLSEKIGQARKNSNDLKQQLLLMWLAYWDFAFAEQHLYQIMFGIETTCCDINEPLTDSQVPATLFSEVIGLLLDQKEEAGETIEKYYYACWSFVHGLISINLIGRHVPQKISEQILTEAISGIIDTLIAPDNNLTKEPYIEEVPFLSTNKHLNK